MERSRRHRPDRPCARLVAVSDDEFTVELESDRDDVLTVRLDGELDMAHAAWVDDTLAAAGAHHRHVAVQLDAITFLDSAGIGVLQSLRTHAERLGITVTFEKPSEAVKHSLIASGLTTLID